MIFASGFTVGEDAVDVTKWFPESYGIPPRVRIGRNRWLNLLWSLPIGVVVLIHSERETPHERPSIFRSSASIWTREFVRSTQPYDELSVHFCGSSEPDFHVPAIRGCLLTFLDSWAPDVAC